MASGCGVCLSGLPRMTVRLAGEGEVGGEGVRLTCSPGLGAVLGGQCQASCMGDLG